MDPDHRPDGLEESRHEVDVDVEPTECPDEIEKLVVVIVRECDDHALDSICLDDLDNVGRRPEQRDPVEVGSHGLRVGVDEANEMDAQFGMLPELTADELTDVARSDDQRVLDVSGTSPHERTIDDAAGYEQGERGDPEDGDLRELRVAAGQPQADDAEPGADRDQMEERQEVIDGGVLGASLVAVVQAVHLRTKDPERQRHAEEDELHAWRVSGGAARHDRCKNICGEQGYCVREHEGSCDELRPSVPRTVVSAELLRDG